MPPAYDLIIERGGSIVVETIEACDEDAACPGADLSLFQQLNRELGALCQEPPAQAIRVCRLHARLVNG